MTIYVLIVAVGFNVVQFGTYDLAHECRAAAEEAVSTRSGDVDALCIDVKNHRIVAMVGRSG